MVQREGSGFCLQGHSPLVGTGVDLMPSFVNALVIWTVAQTEEIWGAGVELA